MNISAVTPKYNTYFCGRNEDDKRKVTTSEVATVTGATGAAATGAKVASKGKNGFNAFRSSGKIGTVTQETANAIKNVRKPLKQVKGLFPKFKQAFKNTKLDILKWADGVKDSHILKPLLKSKAFGAVAGALGAVMGIFVTIAGLGDIANTVTEYTQG